MRRDYKLVFYIDRHQEDKVMVKQVEQRYELDDDELTLEAWNARILEEAEEGSTSVY